MWGDQGRDHCRVERVVALRVTGGWTLGSNGLAEESIVSMTSCDVLS